VGGRGGDYRFLSGGKSQGPPRSSSTSTTRQPASQPGSLSLALHCTTSWTSPAAKTRARSYVTYHSAIFPPFLLSIPRTGNQFLSRRLARPLQQVVVGATATARRPGLPRPDPCTALHTINVSGTCVLRVAGRHASTRASLPHFTKTCQHSWHLLHSKGPIPLRLSPVHSLSLAPATSALAFTLASAAPVHTL
jgi:hypothetical protein